MFRILLTVVVIFRILIVAIVGEDRVRRRADMFVCNTLQPGCNQACYDKAFPHISHQILGVPDHYGLHTQSMLHHILGASVGQTKERRFSMVYLSLDKDTDSMKRDNSKKIKKHHCYRSNSEHGKLHQRIRAWLYGSERDPQFSHENYQV